MRYEVRGVVPCKPKCERCSVAFYNETPHHTRRYDVVIDARVANSAKCLSNPSLEMAVGDALRGAKMFERVGVPVLGIVENMSYFVCPHCNEQSEIFVRGGGQRLADEIGVPLLGQVPLQAQMAEEADVGNPVVLNQPESPAGKALAAVAQEVIKLTGGKRVQLPIVTN